VANALSQGTNAVLDVTGEPNTDNRIFRIIGGAKGLQVPSAHVWLGTGIARSSLSLATLLAATGLVNGATFLGCPIGTVLLWGAEVPQVNLFSPNADIVPVVYHLVYNPQGWPDTVTVAEYTKYVSGEEIAATMSEDTVTSVYLADMTLANAVSPGLGVKRAVTRTKFIRSGDVVVLKADTATFSTLAGLTTWLAGS
jgi:hypothetical protein